MINFYNIGKQNQKFEKQFIEQFKKVNKEGRYILGKNSEIFERNFAKLTGSKYCIAVGNCLDAMRLTFEAYKKLSLIKNGDEVIVPANTYIATILSISQANLKPVLIDPDPLTYNISLSQVAKAYNKKTKAILTVDLYGHPSDLINLKKFAKEKKILLLEDAAQAHGAKVGKKIIGSISDATFFSFFPGKSLGAFGDAGAVTTSNVKLKNILVSLRNYGEEFYFKSADRKYRNEYIGFNSRLDELQAIALNLKLKFFNQEHKKRSYIANYYLKNIKNRKVVLPFIKKNTLHAWHLFIIRCKQRNQLKKYLLKNRIKTMIHYPIPPHKQKAYKNFNNLKLPLTDKLSQEVLSLPLSTTLKKNELKYIVNKINKF